MGGKGNENEVYLTYTSDPVSGAEGKTKDAADVTRTYTFQLEISKVDSKSGKSVKGAGFTIREGTDGLYVQKDGTLAKKAHVFKTNKSGKAKVARIDAGTYTIAETVVPDGYARPSGKATLTIAADYRAGEALATLKATTKSGNVTVGSVSADAGKVVLKAANTPKTTKTTKSTVTKTPTTTTPTRTVTERLAQTGVGPIAGALVAGGIAVTAISVWRSRRDDDEGHDVRAGY